jgi:4-hydroxythreonine-4-phosphate dehydrogenase
VKNRRALCVVRRAPENSSRGSVVAVTMGDPLGIGPEVIVKALSSASLRKNIRFVIIGDQRVFQKLPKFKQILKDPRVSFLALGLKQKITAKNSGEFAVAALEKAVGLIKSGQAQALVTAPISKERVQKAGFNFPGHTEYLCHAFGVRDFAMMLFHPKLRVVLSTIHVPLKDVSRLLTKALIVQKISLTADSLQKNFGIKNPKIAVCGLNPHAGENGLIGDEEKKIILPAIVASQKKHKAVLVSGPHPSDTVFHQALRGQFDAVLCHYHDQALIPIKTTDFYQGVNMTLGLPFIRTSPDHGTAFDLAGKNLACEKSMRYAIQAAKEMAFWERPKTID